VEEGGERCEKEREKEKLRVEGGERKCEREKEKEKLSKGKRRERRC
jgi:hypothetical protein